MRHFLKIAFLFFLVSESAFCQQAAEHIRVLASPEFHGRGYYKNGDRKAAEYIKQQFINYGLLPVNGSYFQPFTFPVNTFPGKMKVVAGEKLLSPGRDFIVSPSCPTIKGKFDLVYLNAINQVFENNILSNKFLVIDKSFFPDSLSAQIDSIIKSPPSCKGLIILEPKKLTWSVSGKVNDRAIIRILTAAWPKETAIITLNIENKLINEYHSQNVLGMIPGTTNKDSFIVFTAHYDHLGRMGKNALFAGANDNASGTAMILELAKFYTQPENRPAKSLLFIAFAGEEAGLIGSKYYTQNPPLPLSNIRFLLNLDLMGNGEEGMMVVNGEIHPAEFALLERINNDRQLLPVIGKRGKAANSDHYWFSEKGVPAFFFYTTGGSKAYHDIDDLPGVIRLTEFEDVQTLIKVFVQETGQ